VSQTVTMTLTEFLLARIAEDEAAAKAAQYVTADDLSDHHEPRWWVKEEHGRIYAGGWLRVVDGGAPAGERSFVNTAALPHIARHDPARILAECAAKRRIVDMHGDSEPGRYVDDPPECTRCDEPYPCEDLRAIALPFADHPDYREEWKP
jgi:hypothetical protein